MFFLFIFILELKKSFKLLHLENNLYELDFFFFFSPIILQKHFLNMEVTSGYKSLFPCKSVEQILGMKAHYPAAWSHAFCGKNPK